MRVQILAQCRNPHCQYNKPDLLELPAVNELGTMFAMPTLICGGCRNHLSIEWSKDDTIGQRLNPH